MTRKNTKKYALITLLILSVAVPLTSFTLVSGQAENSITDNSGSTVIELELQTQSPDRSELIALEHAFNSAQTVQERELIKSQASHILRETTYSQADIQKGNEYTQIKDKLIDAIANMPKQDRHNAIPFTGMGYDHDSKMLEVQIHQDFVTKENMKKYERIIRGIVGNAIDLKLSNGGNYWQG